MDGPARKGEDIGQMIAVTCMAPGIVIKGLCLINISLA